MPDERLRDLQEQLEHHKKQLEQYEQKSALESEKSSSSQIDIEKLRAEKETEIQDLKQQLQRVKKEREGELIALK